MAAQKEPQVRSNLVGDGDTGKTMSVKRHLIGESEKYVVWNATWLVNLRSTWCETPPDWWIWEVRGVKRHLIGESEKYVATLSVESHSLCSIPTEDLPIKFSVWDTAGQEKSGWLRDGCDNQDQCLIRTFDVTSGVTYKNTPNRHRDLVWVCENNPRHIV